ncbi:hypothetical protein EJ04DRAFT_510814 [Polyplosphaeria fusca]|uniref:Zn(2)-C6 fungal-type domain-containing protein n=1 Tax=Polyplosphaeria fusca TaxID=682080 RepID=A0A9P4R583_9PLEO|nr:hypothetical protein EJ04DRAFT_510814 [Polyplosphaeria fusca]
MDLGDDIDDASSRLQRACDSCRSRKIRCDRASPCSNCKASKLTCQTTVPTHKAQKQRVHISEEYEKKIDRIEDRLAGIESVLEKLALRLGDLDITRDTESGSHGNSRSSRVARSPNSSADVKSSTPAPFEGETTLNTQSEFARELLEHTVKSTPSIEQNAEIKAALHSLQAMVSHQSQTAKDEPPPLFTSALADVNASKVDRPPWAAVEDVFEKAATHPTMCFTVVFPYLKLYSLNDICKKAWDSPEDCPPGRRVLVYGVLSNLFDEFATFPLVGRRIESYRQYRLQCRTQLEIAMSQLDLYIPATYENVLALSLAAAYAIELAKPSLCWTMNSTAANLCQILGYHRISTMKDDSDEERAAKIHVFWFIYTTDKTLSLRLGRAASIQDWDISLPFPTNSNTENCFSNSGIQMHLYWIKIAQIQGRTYEKLFSPAAFHQPAAERARIASQLVSELEQAWAERGDASVLDLAFYGSSLRDMVPSSDPSTESMTQVSETRPKMFLQRAAETDDTVEGSIQDLGDLFHHSDTVTHYSTATLIQRAVILDGLSHSTECVEYAHAFNNDCLESARAALAAHQRANKRFNTKGNEDLWSGYLHWSILQAPFTPFIVLFCNAVQTSNHFDLAQLADFVVSLESCRTMSEGADKLYRMCHLFLRVAKLYIEARSKEVEVAHARPHTALGSQSSGYTTASAAPGTANMSAPTQFDPYLSALGLVPNSAWPMATFSMPQSPEGYQGVDLAGLGGNQNTVQDWYSGSRYILGLMEDDIQMPDLNA